MSAAKNIPFPAEMVEEILCRLPVKSLNRFRSVSTHWQSLISNRRFIRKHVRMSSRRAEASDLDIRRRMSYLNFCNLILDLRRLPLSFFACSNIGNHDQYLHWHPVSYNREDRESPKELQRYIFGRSVNWRLIASCDGLLCFFVDDVTIYVSNPCTKTCRKIPDSTSKRNHRRGVWFGYDSVRDDYILIKFSLNGNTLVTEIYSLRSDCWRKAEDFPQGFHPTPSYTFFNGAIHFLAEGHASQFALFTLDLLKNKYTKELPLPEYLPIQYLSFREVRVSALQGSLCRASTLQGMLCFLCGQNNCFKLWVMKDCTDQKSWTEILSVSLFGDRLRPLSSICAMYLYKNGEVMLGAVYQTSTEVLICKDNRITYREIVSNSSQLQLHKGVLHVESLISPF